MYAAASHRGQGHLNHHKHCALNECFTQPRPSATSKAQNPLGRRPGRAEESPSRTVPDANWPPLAHSSGRALEHPYAVIWLAE